jgi:hypothetical protein
VEFGLQSQRYVGRSNNRLYLYPLDSDEMFWSDFPKSLSKHLPYSRSQLCHTYDLYSTMLPQNCIFILCNCHICATVLGKLSLFLERGDNRQISSTWHYFSSEILRIKENVESSLLVVANWASTPSLHCVNLYTVLLTTDSVVEPAACF